MGTKYPDLFAALAAPFEPHEVKVRAAAGRQMHYITARTAMIRLDNVLGPENWWDTFAPGENSVLCHLTIRLPDGSTLTKSDAGGYAGMADSGDDDKSGYSDAFKRAAVKFGIARYLYRDGVPTFARGSHGHDAAPAPQEQPEPTRNGPAPDRQAPQGQGQPQQQQYGPPKTGKALFAWCKDQEQKYEVGLLKYLVQWGRLQEFPARMMDFDAEQVRLAYEEGCRKLKSIDESQGDPQEEALTN